MSDPRLSSQALHAMATLDALGAATSLRFNQLLDKRPDLKERLRRLDPVVAASTFGGLLTAPELQANGVRVEAMVHLALALGRGTQKPSDKLATDVFRVLGSGACGRMEDPAEDVLVGSIRSKWGNFRVLEGLWEGGTFYLQRFIEVIETMPLEKGYDVVRHPVVALLRISEAVCERARLNRWQLGAEMPLDELPKRSISALLNRGRHLRFTKKCLEEIGVKAHELLPFTFDLRRKSELGEDVLGSSILERYPIVVEGGVFHLVLPTAVSAATRYFLVAELERVGLAGSLHRALAASYSKLFEETPLLGGPKIPKFRFELGLGPAFAEVMTGIDEGRWLHLIFVTDPPAGLDESGLAGMSPVWESLGDEIDGRIAHARRTMAERGGFRAGLSIIVTCGVGRGAAIILGRENSPNWRIEHCSAYDLVTLSWTTEFKPSTLWRVLDARDRIEALGIQLENVNGLINLVAWARELDGHLVPHERLPDGFGQEEQSTVLVIDQNRQRGLRNESAVGYDARVAKFLGGRWVRIRRNNLSIFADDRDAPLYASEEPGESGFPMLAFLSPQRTWWADVRSPHETGGQFGYERWLLVGTWLSRSAPLFDAIRGIPDGPVLWNVVFKGAALESRPVGELMSYAEVRAGMRIAVDQDRGIVAVTAGQSFEIAQCLAENIAERALVGAFAFGIALLSGNKDPATEEAALVPQIVHNAFARHGHAFAVRDFRDLVRSDCENPVISISRDDDAFSRLGLGWSVRARNSNPRICGREECRSFLNDLVRHIEDDIISDLRCFARCPTLTFLLNNHESAAFDRDRWRRTSAAMLALHPDKTDTINKIINHDYKLNAVFQSSRVLCEIAICECPIDGTREPTPLDISLLMAKASLLGHVGGWSDAIHWGLMRPELRITPLGDVHANFDYVDEVINPHGHLLSKDRVARAVDGYAENLVDRPVDADVEQRFESHFVDAWQEQIGASIEQTRTFIDFIENLGEALGKAVITIPLSRLRKIESGGRSLDEKTADRLLNVLTFPSRAAWRDLPDGFPERDRQPWRYRRQLSLLRRPLLQIDDAADPTLLIAPGIVRDAFVYTLGNFHRGDFPDYQLSPKMKKWRGETVGARGTVFATEVASALAAAGWETRVEIDVTELLRRGFDRNYGDVDVLAWRQDNSRVLIIECKDVQFRKTYGEIAEQLTDFRGETRANGTRDELRKHLDRLEVIRANLAAVSRLTGIDPLPDVESHLIFRNPVPMEFALKRLAEKVIVSRFDRVTGI